MPNAHHNSRADALGPWHYIRDRTLREGGGRERACRGIVTRVCPIPATNELPDFSNLPSRLGCPWIACRIVEHFSAKNRPPRSTIQQSRAAHDVLAVAAT